MPAMTTDPITASLSRSLGGHGAHGLMRGGNSSSVMGLEARLAATAQAKKLGSVSFDQPVKYGGGGAPSAAGGGGQAKRFIVLNPAAAVKQVGTSHIFETLPQIVPP